MASLTVERTTKFPDILYGIPKNVTSTSPESPKYLAEASPLKYPKTSPDFIGKHPGIPSQTTPHDVMPGYNFRPRIKSSSEQSQQSVFMRQSASSHNSGAESEGRNRLSENRGLSNSTFGEDDELIEISNIAQSRSQAASQPLPAHLYNELLHSIRPPISYLAPPQKQDSPPKTAPYLNGYSDVTAGADVERHVIDVSKYVRRVSSAGVSQNDTLSDSDSSSACDLLDTVKSMQIIANSTHDSGARTGAQFTKTSKVYMSSDRASNDHIYASTSSRNSNNLHATFHDNSTKHTTPRCVWKATTIKSACFNGFERKHSQW